MGRTIADPSVLADLVGRLRRLTPAQPRVWGSITCHQMVSHLGDASLAALGQRPFSPTARTPSRVMKFVALSVPLRFRRWAFLHTDHHLRQFGL